MKTARPGCAQGRFAVVGAERVLQGANHCDLNLVLARFGVLGYVAFPWGRVNEAGGLAVDDYLGDAAVPFGQRDEDPARERLNLKALPVGNPRAVEGMALQVPARSVCCGKSLRTRAEA